MNRTAIAVLTALVAAVGFSMTAVPAQAEGYGVTVKISISDITVVGGTQIRVDAEARTPAGNPVNCAWKVVFHGDSAPFVIGPNPDTGSGSSFHKTYSTKRVPDIKRGFATASCTYEDTTLPAALGGVNRFSTAFPTALQTVSTTGQVNLLPLSDDDDDSDDSDDSDDGDDDDDNSGLPDTGGERLLWLLIGLVLVVGGTTVVVTSRKRDSAA